MANAGEEPTVEPPEEEFDLTKPYWVGYFKLPEGDVKLQKEFLPNNRQVSTTMHYKARTMIRSARSRCVISCHVLDGDFH